jgi:hypothetical protein
MMPNSGERGVLTPTLVGAQPAIYTLNGKTVRPLGNENDKAFALLNSLDAKQKSQAILKYRVADLVLGPGEDGKTIQPEGLKASDMNARQRAAAGRQRHRRPRAPRITGFRGRRSSSSTRLNAATRSIFTRCTVTRRMTTGARSRRYDERSIRRGSSVARGQILIDLGADLPASNGPSRKLTFENHHERRFAAYMSNCTVPSDPHIRVVAQKRNESQSFYQLDLNWAS